jgi:hypothetical protein
LLFFDEKIPIIKVTASHVKGDVLIHGFLWVNTIEYVLAVGVLKIHISLAEAPQRPIVK